MRINKQLYNSGMSLLEVLGCIAVLGIIINLALSLFLDASRLNVLGTEALDKLRQTEEIRREFQEAVRECISVCEQAGSYKTGEDQLVLRAHPDAINGEEERYVILHTVQSPKRLRKIVLVKKNGILEGASVVTYPLEVDLARFTIDKQNLVSMDITLKRNSDRSKREPTIHRFTSFMRGVQS